MFHSLHLKTRCKSCSKKFKLRHNAPSRMDLENDLGTEFGATCEHCSKRSTFHVNDVKAEKNAAQQTIIMTLLGIIFLFFFLLTFTIGVYGFLLNLGPWYIWIHYKNSLEKDKNTFNTNFINRSTNYTPKNPKRL